MEYNNRRPDPNDLWRRVRGLDTGGELTSDFRASYSAIIRGSAM